jgi:NTE family protein
LVIADTVSATQSGGMTVYRLPGMAGEGGTAIVLGGGGNLGATQVGMLRALLERGVEPTVLIGCSVGALNAAGLAAEPTMAGVDRLERVWRELDGEAIVAPGRLSALWLMTRKYRALQANDGLRKLLETSLPFRNFEEARVPLHVVATSMRTGGERWFSRGPVVEPILASAALPAVFPPVEINGELLIDGAVVNNVPISKALELGATRIYVLHVGNFERPRRAPKRPLDALLQSFSIARNFRFQQETERPPAGTELIVLPGVDPGTVKYNDFGRSRELIERAHRATAAWLDAGHLRAAAN